MDPLPAEYMRGYHILLDKDSLLRDLPPSPRRFPQAPRPTAATVAETINEFWFEAIHVAQFIRRREFWVVKYRDWTMNTMRRSIRRSSTIFGNSIERTASQNLEAECAVRLKDNGAGRRLSLNPRPPGSRILLDRREGIVVHR